MSHQMALHKALVNLTPIIWLRRFQRSLLNRRNLQIFHLSKINLSKKESHKNSHNSNKSRPDPFQGKVEE